MKADFILYANQLLTCSPGGSIRRGQAMSDVGLIEGGAVAVADGKVVAVGTASEIDLQYSSEIKLSYGVIMPSLVDAHTHPVFAGSRVDEYIMKANGATYMEILENGGGILSTVRATRRTGTDELLELALSRLDRMLSHGTSLIEAKSGYGLSVDEELRHLRLLKRLKELHPMEIISTFLGAHAVPEEYKGKREDYVSLVCDEMLPRIASENLADFVDVFCEEGAFSLDETARIIEAAKKFGLPSRIHAEQFNSLGGALMSAKMGAFSCDHLLMLSLSDIEELARLDTVCIFLPGSEFFLNIRDYGPARSAIDKGVPVAIATDFNAGSCLSESLPVAMSIAVLQMQFLPEEAIISATVNAAASLGRADVAGSIEKGRSADFLCIDCDDYRQWLYHFGVNMTAAVFKKGTVVYEASKVRRFIASDN